LKEACDIYQFKLETLQELSHEDHDMISIRDLYATYAVLKHGRVQQRHCFHCSCKTSICCVQCSEIRFAPEIIMVCAKCQRVHLKNFGK
jgi:hypothetical protein